MDIEDDWLLAYLFGNRERMAFIEEMGDYARHSIQYIYSNGKADSRVTFGARP